MRLTIDRIEAIPLRVPTIRPHHLAFATVAEMDIVLVAVSAAGITGYGEAATIGGPRWGDESPEGIAAVVSRYLAEALLGEDAANLSAIEERLARAVRGNGFARSAVSLAIHDLVARARDVRLADLLGGALVEAIPLAWTLASGDTARDIEEAERMLALRRHRDFKIKVGARAAAEDLRHLAALGSALADRASLRIDVNQAWDEPTALRCLPALQEMGISLVEQPLPAWNLSGMARLSARGGPVVMADEGIATPQDALRHAKEAACGAVALKPAKHGGVAGTRQVAAIARAAGLGLYGGTMLEGTLGTLGSAHLFATLGPLAWGSELFGPLLLAEPISATPLRVADFALHLPEGPGIGAEPDAAQIARLRTDRPRISHPSAGMP